jgi:ABC-type uncharacterized transport system involved in gliding motility auxiliary subunit
MANRQTKYTAYAGVYLIVVLAILVAVNFLANRYNKTFDTTANKRYSLSDQTEKVVKGLAQDVKITYFDRTDRFPVAKDLLDRYGNLSPKLKVEYVDPYKKPQLAKAAGVKTEGTTFIEIGEKREEAKSVTEEELTGALIRALKGGERNVCFVSGSGEHSIEETRGPGYSQLKELLERSTYKVRNISLLGADRAPDAAAPSKVAIDPAAATTAATGKLEIPKDCTVTVVAGPRFDYTQPAVDALKANVEGGGRVLFMLDPPLRFGREEISENAGLKSVLAGWGVTLDNNLVIDMSGIGQIFGLSEVVPLVTSYESHPIVREMKEVATGVPLTRSVEAKGGDKTTVDRLYSSSKNSFATTNLAAAEIRPDPAKDKKGPLTLAAAGTYQSASGQGRFVVTGSSGWVANNILRFNGNRDLFLNMMNWLSSDEDLISIRPKDPEDRRLSMTSAQMGMIRTVSQFLIPLVVIVAGIAVWWKRR